MRSRDSDGDKFIVSILANADALVTGDGDLLSLMWKTRARLLTMDDLLIFLA